MGPLVAPKPAIWIREPEYPSLGRWNQSQENPTDSDSGVIKVFAAQGVVSLIIQLEA